MQHYVIKFVSDLQQIGGVLWVLRCPPQVASLEWDNLAESYYLSTTEICPNKSLWSMTFFFLEGTELVQSKILQEVTTLLQYTDVGQNKLASLEWDNLAESYYLSTTEICPNKSLW
jgi:hypothetical protein